MLISTKGRYALRVMVDLAEHQTEEFVSLKGIAQRQEISEKYLESIIRMLVKARVLESLRGKGGGYRLKKSPDQYTVGSILCLTEESLAPVSCLEHNADNNRCRSYTYMRVKQAHGTRYESRSLIVPACMQVVLSSSSTTD